MLKKEKKDEEYMKVICSYSENDTGFGKEDIDRGFYNWVEMILNKYDITSIDSKQSV